MKKIASVLVLLVLAACSTNREGMVPQTEFVPRKCYPMFNNPPACFDAHTVTRWVKAEDAEKRAQEVKATSLKGTKYEEMFKKAGIPVD